MLLNDAHILKLTVAHVHVNVWSHLVNVLKISGGWICILVVDIVLQCAGCDVFLDSYFSCWKELNKVRIKLHGFSMRQPANCGYYPSKYIYYFDTKFTLKTTDMNFDKWLCCELCDSRTFCTLCKLCLNIYLLHWQSVTKRIWKKGGCVIKLPTAVLTIVHK